MTPSVGLLCLKNTQKKGSYHWSLEQGALSESGLAGMLHADLGETPSFLTLQFETVI